MLPNHPKQSPDGIPYWTAFPSIPPQCMVPSGRYGRRQMLELGPDDGTQMTPSPQPFLHPQINAHYHQMQSVYHLPTTAEGSLIPQLQGFVPPQNGESTPTYEYGAQAYPVQNEQPVYGAQWAPEFKSTGQGYEYMVQPSGENGVLWSPGHDFVPQQATVPNGYYLYEPQSVPYFEGVSQNENPGLPNQQFVPDANDGQFASAYEMVPPQQYNWVVPQDNGGSQSSHGYTSVSNAVPGNGGVVVEDGGARSDPHRVPPPPGFVEFAQPMSMNQQPMPTNEERAHPLHPTAQPVQGMYPPSYGTHIPAPEDANPQPEENVLHISTLESLLRLDIIYRGDFEGSLSNEIEFFLTRRHFHEQFRRWVMLYFTEIRREYIETLKVYFDEDLVDAYFAHDIWGRTIDSYFNPQ